MHHHKVALLGYPILMTLQRDPDGGQLVIRQGDSLIVQGDYRGFPPTFLYGSLNGIAQKSERWMAAGPSTANYGHFCTAAHSTHDKKREAGGQKCGI